MTLNGQNHAFNPLAPDATLPASAVLSRASGPNALDQPSRASGRQNFSLPQCRLAAIRSEFRETRPIAALGRLISEQQRQMQRATAAGHLESSVQVLLQTAEREEWSQRELARRTGISKTSLRRIRAGQVDALTWLPKLQPAVARLQPD